MNVPEAPAWDSPDGPFDVVDVVALTTDESGLVVGWTPAAEDLFGYSPSSILGRPFDLLVDGPAAYSQLPSPIRWKAFDSGLTGRIALRLSGGRRIETGVRVTSMARHDGSGAFLVTVTDLEHVPWWNISQSVLERFLTNLPYGIAVMDAELRYVWANKALESVSGVPIAERLGKRVPDVLPRLSPDSMEAQLRSALATGDPVTSYEYRGYTPASPESERVFSTTFFRLDDSTGRVLGVGYMGTDVTERKRAQQRLSLLTDAGATIGRTLDVSRTAQELVEAAAPLADFVTVDLFEEVMVGEEPRRANTAEDIACLVRVAQRSVRKGCPETAVSLGERSNLPARSPVFRSLAERRAILETTIGAAGSPDDLARTHGIRDLALRSLMVVPIRARNVSLGVAAFYRGGTRDRFESADLSLAEEFVSRAAVCLDNARRYTRERNAALTLQRSLLPGTVNGGGALEVASRYLPAKARDGVGGDWFDVIPLSGGRVALTVGDVVGHGINAAASMGRLRMAVRTLASMDLAPDELLARLDDLILPLVDDDPTADGTGSRSALLGATCLYGVYDPVTRQCTMARAGHPAPAVVSPDGTAVFVDLPSGPPLGLGSLPFEARQWEVTEGSVLAFFTKGLLSGNDHDTAVDLQRIRDAIQFPDQPLDEMCDQVLDAMGPRSQTDDVALVLARAHAFGGERVRTWDLPADPAIVGDARAMATSELAAWGLDDLVDVVELIVSELVTNAIRYAAGPIRLRLIHDSTLMCEVFDGSSTSPHLRHARVTDEGGRGLFLVAQLARRWGTRYTEDGKIIWAECAPLSLASASSPDLDA